MSSRPSAQVLPVCQATRARASQRDSDAFLVAVLTVAATMVAFYDLLLLAVHVHG